MREARLYERLAGERVRCHVCAHRCVISDGRWGICQARENRLGTLYTHVYGWASSRHVEAIEKKPLYHFLPGSLSYAIGTPGCNFRCWWCQNWQISQVQAGDLSRPPRDVTPEEIVLGAEQAGCRSLSYSYSEPAVSWEYGADVASLARARGLKNVLDSNGYLSRDALAALAPTLDAASVDLKAFRQETYRHYMEANLQPVLDCLVALHSAGVWLEVTTLIIPQVNDERQELAEMAQFIVQELGADTPWHVVRFFPGYKMIDRPATPQKSLDLAWEMGKEAGLRYVYRGGTLDVGETRCPGCGERLALRRSGRLVENRLQGGRCPSCDEPVAGVW